MATGGESKVGARSCGALWACENCDCAVLREGEAWVALGWVPLGSCSRPQATCKQRLPARCLNPSEVQACGSAPLPPHPSSEQGLPPPGTRKEVRMGVCSQVPFSHRLSLYPSAPP